MSKLILIDGNAILHRAFHALPPLTSKDGQITNAVYGFFSMFLKILGDTKPDFVIVCFDRPKPTFRKELFAEYQAHRPKMDEGLVSQVGIVHDILNSFKVMIFELDGYEADDLIGTISKLALKGAGRLPHVSNDAQRALDESSSSSSSSLSESRSPKENKNSDINDRSTFSSFESGQAPIASDVEVIIVSGDRDLLQLVNHRVKMLAPITGITNMLLFDEEKVEEKYNIKPKQIIDYKALIGDASDNYPGVQGVGPKTAVGLLKEYETLEGIYQNLDKIKEKNEGLAQKLKDGEESAEMAKKLATIILDIPITLDLNICSVSKLDKQALIKEFEKFGFKSLVKRLEGESRQPLEPKKEEKKKEGEQLGLL